MRTRVFRRGAPGQAIVEFAMTTLVFLGLVFAIGDFALCPERGDRGGSAGRGNRRS